MAHGLSCSMACGIFLDQESSLCPLHWQADSLPLNHQGKPLKLLLDSYRHDRIEQQIKSTIEHSFIQKIFINLLQCSRHCSGSMGYMRVQDGNDPWLHRAFILAEAAEDKQNKDAHYVVYF